MIYSIYFMKTMKAKNNGYRTYKERKNEIEKKIQDIEAEISEVKEDIADGIKPLRLLGSTVKSLSSRSARVGTQALAVKIAGRLPNPVARLAFPLVVGVVTEKLAETGVQRSVLTKLKKGFSWISRKSMLSPAEELYLLSHEVKLLESNDLKRPVSDEEGFATAEILEDQFREADTDREVEVSLGNGSWY